MPDTRDIGMSEATASLAAIDTRVGMMEKELGGMSSRLIDLEDKFDKVMSGFATEFRAALSGLSTQFSERNKTPWGVLLSGGSLLLTVVVVVGGLAFAPLRSELSTLEADHVTRKEIELRYMIGIDRVKLLEDELRRLHDRELEHLHQQIERMHAQSDLLRSRLDHKD